MRGPDTFNENLFTLRKLEDFVLGGHPLRPILQMVTAALAKIGVTAGHCSDGRNGGARYLGEPRFGL